MATVSASAPRTSSLRDLAAARTGGAREVAVRKGGAARILLGELIAYAGVRRLVSTAALILLGTVLEGFGILLVVPLLRLFLEPGARQGLDAWIGGLLAPLAPDLQNSLLFAGFVALMLLRALILVARDTQLARLQWGFIEEIKLNLFRRLSAAPWKAVMEIERPRLTRALGSDMVQVGMAVNAAMQTAAAALTLAAYCTLAVVLTPALSLLTFGILATVGVGGAVFVRRAGAFGRSALGYDLQTEASASRFLTGLKLAKAQELEAGFIASYAAASSAAQAARVAFVQSMSASRQLVAVCSAFAAATAVFAALLVTDTDPALLVTFVLLLSRTAGPVSQAQQGVQQVANALPLFAELQDLAADLPEARWPDPQARIIAPGARAISLKTASFTHRTAEADPRGGIRAVDFDIARGEFIGVSGATGSGKSTLLDLVAGLAQPDAGAVLFDDRELSETELASHRGSLAYLAADPVLFGGSLRSNLSWVARDAGDPAMWQALETAGATEFVDRLGRGLDSRIDEAGTNLSAGERQQIAIARALLRRPSLLLLDEATSSLDRLCERRLLDKLAALEPRPTILLVSHREESFARCNRVATLSDGEIISIRRA